VSIDLEQDLLEVKSKNTNAVMSLSMVLNKPFDYHQKNCWYPVPYPNPAFCLNAYPDPDPSQTLKSQKVEFLHKNIFYVGNRLKNVPANVH
jgi:hypothetical protein